MDDSVFVEVPKRLFADVGNVASEFFTTKLCLTNFHIELFDVNRSVSIVADQLFTDNDRIFVVATVERHKADQHVTTKCQLTFISRSTVGDDFAFFDLLARLDQWLLVLTSSLVQANVLFQVVNVVADFDASRINVLDLTRSLSTDQHC